MRWAHKRTYLSRPTYPPTPSSKVSFFATVRNLFLYWLLHLFLNLF